MNPTDVLLDPGTPCQAAEPSARSTSENTVAIPVIENVVHSLDLKTPVQRAAVPDILDSSSSMKHPRSRTPHTDSAYTTLPVLPTADSSPDTHQTKVSALSETDPAEKCIEGTEAPDPVSLVDYASSVSAQVLPKLVPAAPLEKFLDPLPSALDHLVVLDDIKPNIPTTPLGRATSLHLAELSISPTTAGNASDFLTHSESTLNLELVPSQERAVDTSDDTGSLVLGVSRGLPIATDTNPALLAPQFTPTSILGLGNNTSLLSGPTDGSTLANRLLDDAADSLENLPSLCSAHDDCRLPTSASPLSDSQLTANSTTTLDTDVLATAPAALFSPPTSESLLSGSDGPVRPEQSSYNVPILSHGATEDTVYFGKEETSCSAEAIEASTGENQPAEETKMYGHDMEPDETQRLQPLEGIEPVETDSALTSSASVVEENEVDLGPVGQGSEDSQDEDAPTGSPVHDNEPEQSTENLLSLVSPPSSLPSSQASVLHLSVDAETEASSKEDSVDDHQVDEPLPSSSPLPSSQPRFSSPDRVFSSPPQFSSPLTSPQLLPEDKRKEAIHDTEMSREDFIFELEPSNSSRKRPTEDDLPDELDVKRAVCIPC